MILSVDPVHKFASALAGKLPLAPRRLDNRQVTRKMRCMGLRKWLARIGAPGGTARWAAKGYACFRSRHPDDDPDFPDSAIFRLMVVTRYESVPNQEHETYLLDQCNKVEGLMGLVIEILRVEAALLDNDGHAIHEILEAIASELEKADLPPKIIYGRNKRILDYSAVLF